MTGLSDSKADPRVGAILEQWFAEHSVIADYKPLALGAHLDLRLLDVGSVERTFCVPRELRIVLVLPSPLSGAMLAKRHLVEGFCMGHLSLDLVQRAFSRWPWLREA